MYIFLLLVGHGDRRYEEPYPFCSRDVIFNLISAIKKKSSTHNIYKKSVPLPRLFLHIERKKQQLYINLFIHQNQKK